MVASVAQQSMCDIISPYCAPAGMWFGHHINPGTRQPASNGVPLSPRNGWVPARGLSELPRHQEQIARVANQRVRNDLAAGSDLEAKPLIKRGSKRILLKRKEAQLRKCQSRCIRRSSGH